MTDRAPIIGITAYGPDGAPPSFSLPVAYVEAVERAGGAPLLLPATRLTGTASLDRIHGLILAGGGDIAPDRYGGGEHPMVYMVNSRRDEFELELVSKALKRPELPVLGICRGMQILNVALEGDLELHLPDVRGETVVHRLPPREPTLHDVRVDEGSVLHELYGLLEFPVCSWHHQEVRRLGSGLRPIAYAADGVIEAVVYDDHPWALGVQWHPELQIDDHPLQRRIFDTLVTRARESI